MQFDIKGAQIQKAYSSTRYIALQCRKPGKSFNLFIGRGNHFEGIWLGELKIDSQLRIIDQFLEYIRKYLSSSYIESIEMNDKDRVIYLNYAKYGKINTFSFFYKGRELFFANKYYDIEKEKFITFVSWNNQKKSEITESVFFELGIDDLDKTKENKFIDIDKLLENEFLDAKKVYKKTTHKVKKKIQNIKKDLETIRNYEKLYQFVNDQSDLSILDKKMKIHGVRFNFKFNDHFKRRDQIYTKAKNLKKVEPMMLKRLQQSEELLVNIENDQKIKNQLTIIKPVIKNIKNVKNNSQSSKDYKIDKINELSVAIGKTSQGNDQMRKEWAKKEDWWFHLDANTSTHIIVKGELNKIMESIEVIAKLMKDESGLETNEVNMIYTQVKNLKGNKGKAGSVIYKKIKYIRVNL